MYPTLTEMIDELALDNGILSHTKKRSDWEWPDSAPRLERMAKLMTEDERMVFVAGDEDECFSIVEKHNIQELHDFLNMVFDGPLTRNFFAK